MAKSDQQIPSMKLVIVGDGAVGKTCLLMSYTKGIFPEEYIPTVFDNYTEEKEITLKDPKQHKIKVRLDLWDTAGQEEFDRIRPLSYRDADFFLICFAIDSPDSFDHVIDKWVPEIRHHAPDRGYLLIGLKSDLRNNNDDSKNDKTTSDDANKEVVSVIPIHKIMTLCNEIGAEAYVECSALKVINVSTVFETAMKRYLQPQKKKRNSQAGKRCKMM